MFFSANSIHALIVLIAPAYGYPGPIPRSHAPVTHVAPRLEGADVACSTFAAAWPEAVVTRANTTEYTSEIKAHWSQTAWKSPDCIVTPASVQELQSAYSQIVSSNVTFAIRGCGHSPLPLWANVDNGILLSTKSITSIEFNETSETVRAGFGNNWGALYTYLRPYGRIVVGGRSPSVGLATILGGGLSHLSSLYGFVSDNVLEFELINGSGELIRASSQTNAELFYALKAGGTNFGIVTHVTMRTFPLEKVWGGALVFTNDHRDDIMRALSTYQNSGQLDAMSAVLPYMGLNNDTTYIILVYLDEVEKPEAFRPFYDIPSIYDGTRVYDSLMDLISEDLNLVVPRWIYGATTFLQDEQLYIDVAKIAQNATSRLSSINGGSLVFQPQPISTAMINNSLTRGTSPLTARLENKAQIWLEMNFGWNYESDDSRVGEILEETLAQIEKLAKMRQLYSEFVFPNDAYLSQDPLRSFGTNTFRKLKRISRTYDPMGIFQSRLAGGFKLGA
ncbi:hypothetical protein DPSP01_007050 [Paraphaeosphaeria sporulosa]|uniref:Bifunctional solanapyrone synthase n=1 Tax=Paraphaeosphaeria sporulosa TaxID=1460663 RepID=A0A177CGQ8_9PLEO|nr:bifunctional solanapyrone synthase [Paraphaeosphaeria sporulosa]OAG05887.1 bifunctional solanapyrone synthase [Paraphaeosphaeria sporulosa]